MTSSYFHMDITYFIGCSRATTIFILLDLGAYVGVDIGAHVNILLILQR